VIKKKNNIDSLIYSIIAAIEDIKGKKINILDLRDLENTVCDYFVVCEGNSNTQVNAIVNSIQKKVSKELKDKPWGIEGNDNAEWVLMDYINVVVHVFQKHKRDFYDIESLWGDAKLIEIISKN
jgi:ribosome-associated protein